MTDLVIRKAAVGDAQGIVEAHRAAILEKAKTHYDEKIIEAWAPEVTPDRVSRMIDHITNEQVYTVVAESGGQIIGFGQMNVGENRLGAVYVRKSAFGGVGGKILQHLIQTARERGARFLTMDASLNSELFYNRFGFKSINRGTHVLKRAGIEMPCVKMKLELP